MPGYTAGTPQTYTLTLRDPDGVADVRATLDGSTLPVAVNGDSYSVTVPPDLAVGTHSVVFTGTGKAPDGSRELPRSEGLSITVYASNTPLTLSTITGPTAYTAGSAQTYHTTVVDPNGIGSVTATANGQTIALVQSGSQYSLTLPASTPAGSVTLLFTAIGLAPDGSKEAAKTASQTVTVFASNTPLSIGTISGLASYTLGAAQTYSLSPIDPDGVGTVTATLDGASLAVLASGASYSVTVPASTAAGTHTLRFSASGKRPDGSTEDPMSVSRDIAILAGNTPLSISPWSGPISYPAGQVQAYSATVIDPNGIGTVSATLDGQALSVVSSGSSYSVTLPVSVAAGSHTLTLSAVGKTPDGAAEAAQSVSLAISVIPSNTPLSISPIIGRSGIAYGTGEPYSTTVVDPEGILSVSATLDGKALPVTQDGSTYYVTVPASTSLGDHLLEVSATGRQLDGTAEIPQSVSRVISVSVFNTVTTLSSITETPGPPATFPLTVFSVTVTDPDGVASVTATFDGAAFVVTKVGSTYSIQMAYSAAHPGPHTVEFTAIGLLPDGTVEPSRTVNLVIP